MLRIIRTTGLGLRCVFFGRLYAKFWFWGSLGLLLAIAKKGERRYTARTYAIINCLL